MIKGEFNLLITPVCIIGTSLPKNQTTRSIDSLSLAVAVLHEAPKNLPKPFPDSCPRINMWHLCSERRGTLGSSAV